MFFTILVGLTALLVAGTAAYFSVLGIATLFSGSYYQVMVMAGALEIGKLVATSYLHRYWKATSWWLKPYLIAAIVILMGITSMGVFGYLSAAYQVNSSNFAYVDSQVALIEQQKESIDKEIAQNNQRIDTLNQSRASQEARLVNMSSRSSQPIYKDIEKSGEEIRSLNERTATLQESKQEKDKQIIELKSETAKAKDIGTFKFVAEATNRSIDTVVTAFICVLICVFDPLAVALVLAFNTMTTQPAKRKQPIAPSVEDFVPSEPILSEPEEEILVPKIAEPIIEEKKEEVALEIVEPDKKEVEQPKQKKKRFRFYWHDPSLE